MLSEAERAVALDQELMADVARGARVEARMPTWAIIVTGKPVNHVLHLLVTVLLCGLWLPVWIIMAVNSGEKRTTLTVDETGQVQRSTRAPTSPNANWLGRMSENQATLVVIGAIIGSLVVLSLVMHH